MSLIPCDQKCRHQQEGYCYLDQIARLTSDHTARCGYFEPPPEQKRPAHTGEPLYGEAPGEIF